MYWSYSEASPRWWRWERCCLGKSEGRRGSRWLPWENKGSAMLFFWALSRWTYLSGEKSTYAHKTESFNDSRRNQVSPIIKTNLINRVVARPVVQVGSWLAKAKNYCNLQVFLSFEHFLEALPHRALILLLILLILEILSNLLELLQSPVNHWNKLKAP